MSSLRLNPLKIQLVKEQAEKKRIRTSVLEFTIPSQEEVVVEIEPATGRKAWLRKVGQIPPVLTAHSR